MRDFLASLFSYYIHSLANQAQCRQRRSRSSSEFEDATHILYSCHPAGLWPLASSFHNLPSPSSVDDGRQLATLDANHDVHLQDAKYPWYALVRVNQRSACHLSYSIACQIFSVHYDKQLHRMNEMLE